MLLVWGLIFIIMQLFLFFWNRQKYYKTTAQREAKQGEKKENQLQNVKRLTTPINPITNSKITLIFYPTKHHYDYIIHKFRRSSTNFVEDMHCILLKCCLYNVFFMMFMILITKYLYPS